MSRCEQCKTTSDLHFFHDETEKDMDAAPILLCSFCIKNREDIPKRKEKKEIANENLQL